MLGPFYFTFSHVFLLLENANCTNKEGALIDRDKDATHQFYFTCNNVRGLKECWRPKYKTNMHTYEVSQRGGNVVDLVQDLI